MDNLSARTLVIILWLLAANAALGQPEPVLWATTVQSPTTADVVEVQNQPGTPCGFWNWGINGLPDAATGLWWDDPRGPLLFVLRSTLNVNGIAWVDVYTQTGAPPYFPAGSFPLTIPNSVGNSITVQIPTGIVVVAQPPVPGVSPATVSYYNPPAYGLLMTHACPNQIASFDHITGDCQGNLFSLATDVNGIPVLTCLPDPRVAGCPCPGIIQQLPVQPPVGSTWNNEYITCDKLGGVWMCGSYGAGRLDGEVWYYNGRYPVFLPYIPPVGQTRGGRFIFPAFDPNPANCDQVDVYVAEQSTMPGATTARIYRLRFTPAPTAITIVNNFRYANPPVHDALGTINVETAGATPGFVWLTVADLTVGQTLFDQFNAMLAPIVPCGLATAGGNFSPWAQGSGSRYSRLVCPTCP